jgi:hypothetical protein
MACVVAPPGDQVLPVAALEFKVTLPPAQKVVGPLGVITGPGGAGVTVTTTGVEAGEVQPATV